ncbi:MAG: hypothetical protein AAFQ98_10610 [Bacteroidota bacterium]
MIKRALVLLVGVAVMSCQPETYVEPLSVFDQLAGHLEEAGYPAEVQTDGTLLLTGFPDRAEAIRVIDEILEEIGHADQAFGASGTQRGNTLQGRGEELSCDSSEIYYVGDEACQNYICIGGPEFSRNPGFVCFDGTCISITTTCVQRSGGNREGGPLPTGT